MGFQTLAIEQQAVEVWRVLGAVKTEFGKFGGVLDKVKRQLDTAGRTIEETGVRTRAMERKLRAVEQLPDAEAELVLDLASAPSTRAELARTARRLGSSERGGPTRRAARRLTRAAARGLSGVDPARSSATKAASAAIRHRPRGARARGLEAGLGDGDAVVVRRRPSGPSTD